MKQAGIIESKKGPQGGFILKKHPTLFEIFEAFKLGKIFTEFTTLMEEYKGE